MVRIRVYNPIRESDHPCIQAALTALYQFIVPGIVIDTAASQVSDHSLANFLAKKGDPSVKALEALAARGLAEIATLAFMFNGGFFDTKHIFFERLSSNGENKIGLRVASCNSQWGLYALKQEYPLDLSMASVKEMHAEQGVKTLVEYTVASEHEGTLYFGNAAAIHHDGKRLLFPERMNEIYPLHKNTVFNEKSFSVILKCMLIPLMVLNDFLLGYVREEVAVYMATTLTYQHMKFFEEFVKSEVFLTWFFSAPEEKIEQCSPSKNDLEFFNANRDFIVEKRIKITFLIVKAKVENAYIILGDLIKFCCAQKKTHQVLGLDLHAILLATQDFLSDIDNYFLLDCFELSNLFLQKIKFVLFVLKYLQVEIDAQKSEKLTIFTQALMSVADGSSTLEESERETDFVEVVQEESQEKLRKLFVTQFFLWLEKLNDQGILENKVTLLCHYERVYNEHFKDKESSSRRFYGVASAYSYASSFWSSTGSLKRNFSETQFSMTDFQDAEKLFGDAENNVMLQRAFAILLATQGGEIEVVHKKFITALVLQFQRECIAKKILFEEDFAIAKYSGKYANTEMLDNVIIEGVAAEFIQKMRDSVTSSTSDHDEIMVDSKSMFKTV